jgi:hypothetical protein
MTGCGCSCGCGTGGRHTGERQAVATGIIVRGKHWRVNVHHNVKDLQVKHEGIMIGYAGVSCNMETVPARVL